MYCVQCGTQLPNQAKYCSSCGAHTRQPGQKATSRKREIPREKEKLNRKAPPKVAPLYIILAIIGIGLILVLLNPWHAGQERPTDFLNSGEQAQSVAPETHNTMMQIAGKFMCPCGECSDILAECDCDMPKGSVEVKGFIIQGLQQGKTPEQVTRAVEMKYGHRRPGV